MTIKKQTILLVRSFVFLKSDMGKHIVLALGDDKGVLEQSLQLASTLENGEVRCFHDVNCFHDLGPEDVGRIIIYGHAGRTTYDEFSPTEFVKVFNKALEQAGIDKSAIKKLNCIGCEIGLVDEHGDSLAQKLVNEFQLNGYNLILSSFAHRLSSLDQVAHLRIAPDSVDAHYLNIYGIASDALAEQQDVLFSQRNDQAELLARWKQTTLPFPASFFPSIIVQAQIDAIQRQLDQLNLEIINLPIIPIARESVDALESKLKYQFSPKFTKDLETVFQEDQREISRLQMMLEDEPIEPEERERIISLIAEREAHMAPYRDFAARYPSESVVLGELEAEEIALAPDPGEVNDTVKITGMFRDRMMSIKKLPSETQDIKQIVKLLSAQGALDEKTFNYLTLKGAELQEKAGQIENVFKKMLEAKVPIVGNRRPVMELDSDSLLNLGVFLEHWNTEPKFSMDESTFKTLRNNLQNFQGDPEQLSNCVKAMVESKIPLTSLFGEANLQRLMQLSTDQLERVENELTRFLSQGTLNEKTFNDTLGSPRQDTKLQTKENLTGVRVFKQMAEAQISIKDNRELMMGIEQSTLVYLSFFLNDWNTEPKYPMDESVFKVLIKNLQNFQDSPGELSRFMKTMLASKIPLTENTLLRVMSLLSDSLKQVEKMLKVLPSSMTLDEKSFNDILDDNKVPKILELFDKMDELRVDTKKNKLAVLKLSATELDSLISSLNQLAPILHERGLDDQQFKQLISGARTPAQQQSEAPAQADDQITYNSSPS